MAVVHYIDAESLRSAQAFRILQTLDDECTSLEIVRSTEGERARWIVVVEAAATGAVETFRGGDVADALAQAAQWLNLEKLRERPLPFELELAVSADATEFEGSCSSCDCLVPKGAEKCPRCQSTAAIILLDVVS